MATSSVGHCAPIMHVSNFTDLSFVTKQQFLDACTMHVPACTNHIGKLVN